MKAVELRDLGVDELGVRERDLADQLFRMRIQKSMGQLEAPEKIRIVREEDPGLTASQAAGKAAGILRHRKKKR